MNVAVGSVAHCPSCQKEVRIPSDLPPMTTVECPHCASAATVAEFRDPLPPMVKVAAAGGAVQRPVDERAATPTRPEAREGDDRLALQSQSAASQATVAEAKQSSASAQASTEANAEAAKVAATENSRPQESFRNIHVPSFERTVAPHALNPKAAPTHKRRKHKSHPFSKADPKTEGLRLVLGAIVAVLLIQLLLWWAFSADPLRIAPAISRVAPFAVPHRLRPATDDEPFFPRSRQVQEEGGADSPPGAPITLHDVKPPPGMAREGVIPRLLPPK